MPSDDLTPPFTKSSYPELKLPEKWESSIPEAYKYAALASSIRVGKKEYRIYGYRMNSSPSEWPKEVGVYTISNTFPDGGGKNLVGKTESKGGYRQRWAQHRYALRRGNHGNRYIQRSYNIRNEGDFIFWVLEPNLIGADLSAGEAFWYEHLKADQGMSGWNLTIPGKTGTAKQSKETRELIRQKLIGQKRSPEVLENMRKCRVGKTRVISEQEKDTLSRASRRNIPIILKSPDGDEMSFHGLRAAARVIGVNGDKFIHFACKSKPGDNIFGWIMVSEYMGKKSKEPRKRFHEIVRDQDGKDWDVYDTREFARLHELPVRRFTDFLYKSPIGTFFCGLTKTNPYKGVSYS